MKRDVLGTCQFFDSKINATIRSSCYRYELKKCTFIQGHNQGRDGGAFTHGIVLDPSGKFHKYSLPIIDPSNLKDVSRSY